MAPDLNSIPSSPSQQRHRGFHSPSATHSRRPSQVMHPSSTSPAMHHSPVIGHGEQGVPLRHPRPMTAAELHHELEQEQEAVVNRLTRELTALRAQHSASVASNHSLSSTTSMDPANDTTPTHHQITGPTHPTPSRRHRSSSSLSRTNPSHAPASHGRSQASADRHAAAGGAGGGSTGSTGVPAPPVTLSRQPSVTASGSSTPARASMDPSSNPGGLTLPHRPTLSHAGSSSAISVASTAATQGSATMSTPNASSSLAGLTGGGGGGSSISSPSFVDAEAARKELEAVKSENDALRDKVRSLERALRQRRRESGASEVAFSSASSVQAQQHQGQGAGGGGGQHHQQQQQQQAGVNVSAWAALQGVTGVAGPRERSESQSTEASVRRHLGALTQEERDEAVRVGESAGSNPGVRG